MYSVLYLLLGVTYLCSTSFAEWSDSVYNELTYLANYDKVAYCTTDTDFTNGLFKNECSDIAFCDNSDVEIVKVFNPSLEELELSGSGYVAADHSNKTVYVVFRGSITIGDWVTDVIFNYCPYVPILSKNNNITGDLFSNVTRNTPVSEIQNTILDNSDGPECEDCFVHCGIYIALTQFLEEAVDAAKPYISEGYELVVTGHSLGGGYASIAGFELLNAGYKPLVITYSSLRVGNPAYNEYVDGKFNTQEAANVVGNGGDLPIPSFSRVFQETDLVPRLPPGEGYTHAGLQFEITKVKPPQLKDNVVYKGASDNQANDSYNYTLTDPIVLTFQYQHEHVFRYVGGSCNDVDILGSIANLIDP